MMIYGYYLVNKEDRLRKLNKDIKEYKRGKRKIVFRKGLCYGTGIGLVAVAGLAIPTVCTVLACNFNHSPFKRDEVSTPAHVRTEFDSAKGVDTSRQYEAYENEKNSLYYHSGWTENNGQYYSTEISYEVEGLTYDEINGCIRGERDFGKKLQEKTIIREDVTAEELAKGPYYDGVVYEIDNNDVITTTQSNVENFNDVLRSIVIPGIFSPSLVSGVVKLLPDDLNDMFGNDFNPDCTYGYYSNINDDLKSAKRRKKELIRELKKNSD